MPTLPEPSSPTAPRPDRPSRTRAYGVTALLLLFMLLNFADKAVLGLSAASISAEFGLSASAYGLLNTVFFACFSLAAVLVGFLSNRVRTKWLILAMALAWTAAQLPLLVPAAGYTTLLVTRLVLGAAEGPAYPVANHAVHKWFTARGRNVASGILSAGIPLGVIIAGPVLGGVIDDHGWRWAFGVTGFLTLGFTVLWLAVGREGPYGAVAGDAPREQEESGPDVPTWKVLLTPTWIAGVVGGLASYWAVTVLIAWVPQYLANVLDLGTRTASSAIVFPWAAQGIAMVATGLAAAWLLRRGLSSRIANGLVGGVCVTVAGVAVLLLPHVSSTTGAVTLIAVGFGLGAVILPLAQTMSTELAPVRRRGGVLGAYTAVYSLAGVVQPVLTGRLIDTAGSPADGYRHAFTLTGLLLVAGGVVFMALVRPERDRARLLGAGPPADDRATVPVQSTTAP
ncbi:MFS transporter [Streptomyces sp. SID8352]|uniref:MFS transporter n=1 Tax=Streptomyces sp. SID8352 TaxID=2690338 RepID=UPI00136FA81F|nr:MFS transporter [Streptomyces sp. SID8352]MYU20470.1 MFS transporter [Streptomyces sp. SID8352]